MEGKHRVLPTSKIRDPLEVPAPGYKTLFLGITGRDQKDEFNLRVLVNQEEGGGSYGGIEASSRVPRTRKGREELHRP